MIQVPGSQPGNNQETHSQGLQYFKSLLPDSKEIIPSSEPTPLMLEVISMLFLAAGISIALKGFRK